ncbi:tRNA threonylcarbamoyladenosine biosynthesis protein TsaB [Ligilactobacillus salitolerans]|uniref:tRNA threonylcarbamoyladenosine biosynthesis protein TsaB n=1 Tax=Ligilactobacillus salitolerans TaxID=1808352 RepID=A0A401IVH6_9LACO|nr:tRNA threonylcarbamoyladenosine biosynthesis protein TsaB [Ligilactobacillus salitolerans]
MLAENTTAVGRNHSVALMPLVDNIFKQSSLTPAQIDRIVVAQGPGSYTGLRIGITTAKTLAYSLDKELVGVSSLAVLAAGVQDVNSVIVPVFDARRGNVFAGGYVWQNGQLVNRISDQHISFAALCRQLPDRQVCFVGADAQRFEAEMKQNLTPGTYRIGGAETLVPRAFNLGQLGRFADPVNVNDFVPNYLRLTQAETQWLAQNPKEKDNNGAYVKKI